MRTSTLMLLTWLKTMENKELKAIIQAVTDEQRIRKGNPIGGKLFLRSPPVKG